MDLRQTLFTLAAEHGAPADARLQRAAGLHGEPPSLAHTLPRAVLATGATLFGLGLVFWVAANWDTLGRFGRLALLQGVVLGGVLMALWRPALRVPGGLLALLATGALFATFGQTYQTGADPWQLFALWAVLTLPLALAVRSDALWAPWALVAMVAVSLWAQAHMGHRWRADPDTLNLCLVAWTLTLALVAALSPPLARFTGAGPWSFRLALVLAVVAISGTALGALFSAQVGAHFALGLAVLALMAGVLALPRSFDVFGLSAAVLGLDTLLVCGLARWLFDDHRGGDAIGTLLVLGLAAAGLLAASVSGVLRLVRSRA
ncbi:MAG: DUF2157 domain-containing protein [Rubrivivax sp.]|nr:DUF2157 domain-containing protein [Rubrivivax sp.]